MALFETFERWQDADFAAWQPAKRASNRFTPERSRVRERCKSLLEQALDRCGIARSPLEVWASKPEPSFFNDHSVDHIAVVLTRAQADRERLESQHAQLSAARPEVFAAHAGLVVDANGVEVALRVPALAQADVAAAIAAAGDWAGWADLFGWAVATTDGVAVARRWDVAQALAWEDPSGDLAMWLSQALPALQALIGQFVLPEPAAPAPAAARTSAPLPPAAVQASARAWQPYRPQMPAPPRKVPLEPRPSLLERLDPFRLQPEPEPPPPPPPPPPPHRPEQRQPEQRQPEQRQPEQRQPEQRQPEQRQPEQRRDTPRDRWNQPPQAAAQRPDQRPDQRPQPNREPRREAFAPPRQQDRPQPPPQPPTGPKPGDKCLLVGGLLAGKEGQIVATGRTIRVRVGALEFELQPYQVEPQ